MGPQALQDSNAVWQRTFQAAFFRRPQHQLVGNTSYFFNTGSLGHELKLGGSYRKTSVGSETIWPGGGIVGYQAGSGVCATPTMPISCAGLTRQSNSKGAGESLGVYLSDVIKADRLTISAGVRYDWQAGHVRESTAPASALFPEQLPAATAPARDNVIEWEDFSPRIGLTYAIGKDRRTLARMSYAGYANSLWAYPTSTQSAIPGVAQLYFPWNDANNNGIVEPSEIDFTRQPPATSYIRPPANFNPLRATDPVSPNAISSGLEAQKTDEIVVGIDHELAPNFAVGLAYTYRRYDDFYHTVRYDSATGRFLTPADYVFDHNLTPDSFTNPNPATQAAIRELARRLAGGFSVPVYTTTVRPVPPGSFFVNRPNYTQTFNGAELTLTKRLSGGWMARASFAWSDPRQEVGRGACVDPTNTQYSSYDLVGGCFQRSQQEHSPSAQLALGLTLPSERDEHDFRDPGSARRAIRSEGRLLISS